MMFDSIPKQVRKSNTRATQKNTNAALKDHLRRVKQPNGNKVLSPLKSLIIQDLPLQPQLLDESPSIFVKDDGFYGPNEQPQMHIGHSRYQPTKLPSVVVHVKNQPDTTQYGGGKRMWSRHYPHAPQSQQYPQTAHVIGNALQDDSLSETSDTQELHYIRPVNGPITLQRRLKVSKKRQQQFVPRMTQQYQAMTQRESQEKTQFNESNKPIPRASFGSKVMTAKGENMGGGFRAHTQNVMRAEIIPQHCAQHEPASMGTQAFSRNDQTSISMVKASKTIWQTPANQGDQSPTTSHRESFRGAQLHKRSWGAGFNQETQQKPSRQNEQHGGSPFRVVSITRTQDVNYIMPGALHLSSSIGFVYNDQKHMMTSQSPAISPSITEKSIKALYNNRKSPKQTRMKRSIQVWATANSQDDSMLDYSKHESSLDEEQKSIKRNDTQKDEIIIDQQKLRLNQPTQLLEEGPLSSPQKAHSPDVVAILPKQNSGKTITTSPERMKYDNSDLSRVSNQLSHKSKETSVRQKPMIFGVTAKIHEGSRDSLRLSPRPAQTDTQQQFNTINTAGARRQQLEPFKNFIQIEDAGESQRALVASAGTTSSAYHGSVSPRFMNRSPKTAATPKVLTMKRTVRQGSNVAWFTEGRNQVNRARRGPHQMLKINQTMERFADLLQEEKEKLQMQAQFNTTQ